MKIIFIIILFLNTVVLYSQVPNIDISIHDIQITNRIVSFRYTIKNESEIPVWLHRTGGGYIRFQLTGNILFIAPVYDHATRWIGTGFVPDPGFTAGTIRIDPRSEIDVYYSKSIWAPSPDGITYWEDFTTTDYIDLMLVFTPADIKGLVDIWQYREFLSENAIVVNKMFEAGERTHD